MMTLKPSGIKYYPYGLLLILLFTVILLSVACEPPAPIRIINHTDQVLTIFISGERIGNVKPSEEIKNENPRVPNMLKEYQIEAKNSKGDVIYSKKFSRDDLSRNMNWEVVIPTN